MTEPPARGLRERTGIRTVTASSTADLGLAVVVVLGALLIGWTATYIAGGSKTAMPHVFYVPVIVAAMRFNARGAALVAITAGVVAGPLMPLSVDDGSMQDIENWAARLVAFVLIGQLTSYLSEHSLPSLTNEIAGRRFRQELADAIAHDQLRLEYQPIVDLTTGAAAGVEALIRWDHPERGPVRPDQFITDAERLGCVHLVTRFVVAEACRQVAAWREGPLADIEGFKLTVNVSAADLDGDTLVDNVTDVLAETGLPAHWLHLEITETALVADIDAVAARLMALRMLGIRLAIDDFGTGESSLAHLHRFPVDVLKIDRIFLDQLGRHERGDVVARRVIDLAHAMNLTTVAEGVETPVQARLVRSLGCDMAQGYLFARPLRPDDTADLLVNPVAFRTANGAHLTDSAPRRGQET